MKTRRQTNSLPPPRFNVKEVAADEALGPELEVRIDDAARENAHKFLLRLNVGKKKKKGNLVFSTSPAISGQGQVSSGSQRHKSLLSPDQLVLSQILEEKEKCVKLQKFLQRTMLRLRVEEAGLTSERARIESRGQVVTAERLVRLNVDAADLCSRDAVGADAGVEDGVVGPAGVEKPADSGDAVAEPGSVVDMFREASRRNWGMADGMEGDEAEEDYDTDLDLSVSDAGGSSRRPVVDENDEEEDSEHDSDSDDQVDEGDFQVDSEANDESHDEDSEPDSDSNS